MVFANLVQDWLRIDQIGGFDEVFGLSSLNGYKHGFHPTKKTELLRRKKSAVSCTPESRGTSVPWPNGLLRNLIITFPVRMAHIHH